MDLFRNRLLNFSAKMYVHISLIISPVLSDYSLHIFRGLLNMYILPISSSLFFSLYFFYISFITRTFCFFISIFLSSFIFFPLFFLYFYKGCPMEGKKEKQKGIPPFGYVVPASPYESHKKPRIDRRRNPILSRR